MTRTPEQIYADITLAMTKGVDRLLEMDDVERGQFLTGQTERLHALWAELARVVTADRNTPGWASLAVVLLRDRYAHELEKVRS